MKIRGKQKCLVVRFDANGREVIMKPKSKPIWDEQLERWLIVGNRWQWFRNDFSKVLSRISAERYSTETWEW